MRLFVTGGAGFIGSTLTSLLLERGYSVRVYDDLSSGSREHLERLDVELVLGDVRDLESLQRACDGIDAMLDAMFCFAGGGTRGCWVLDRR